MSFLHVTGYANAARSRRPLPLSPLCSEILQPSVLRCNRRDRRHHPICVKPEPKSVLPILKRRCSERAAVNGSLAVQTRF
jgi:hypothetical protein